MKEQLTGLVVQLPALGDKTVVLYAEKLLYRAQEAADCLGLSRSKVYELIQAGVLPAVRVDGCQPPSLGWRLPQRRRGQGRQGSRTGGRASR